MAISVTAFATDTVLSEDPSQNAGLHDVLGRNQMLRNVQALLEFAEGTLENRKLKHIPSGFAKWWIYNGESIINVQQIQASNKDSNLGAPTRHGSFSPLVKAGSPPAGRYPKVHLEPSSSWGQP